ncbi:hypothetical protein J6TS7_35680 [Paenibacillus dendritiformis]|nr:hypothetical protein J6TS7_35680 [Paenibacillus dendritiformis]
MGLGALIIQERMQLTDRETLESISENPYIQYFISLPGFMMKPPFHHSMMTHFRKCLTDVLAELNEIVASAGAKETKDNDDNNDASNGGGKGKRSRSALLLLKPSSKRCSRNHHSSRRQQHLP